MLRQRNLNRNRDHDRKPGQDPIVVALDGADATTVSDDDSLLPDTEKPERISRHDDDDDNNTKDTTTAVTAVTDTTTVISSSSNNNNNMLLRKQPVWLLLAIASGSCAAFNGVFAKLTTTSLTTSWSHAIIQALSLSSSPTSSTIIEYLIRATFFGLNLLFNVAMWSLFTAALTRASSTTRVSVINVSANFFSTALLGLVVFGERLPPTWWVGAGLLAAGSVVIGRREEDGVGEMKSATGGGGGGGRGRGRVGLQSGDVEEGAQLLLGEDLEERDGIVLDGELGGEEMMMMMKMKKEAGTKREDADGSRR